MEPLTPRESTMKIAEDAIDLFLEYRDKHGHDEEAAKYCALNEFAEAESEEVRTSSETTSKPVAWRVQWGHANGARWFSFDSDANPQSNNPEHVILGREPLYLTPSATSEKARTATEIALEHNNDPTIKALAKAAGWVGVADPLRYLQKYIARTEKLAGRMVMVDAMGGVENVPDRIPSATTRISAIPLIKRLKQQRDEIADVLRQAFDARGCRVVNHDGSCVVTSEWVEAATVALRDVPTYEQQIRNIAEGIGMSYDDLIAAVSASSDSGNPR